jgi:hypothetical protein
MVAVALFALTPQLVYFAAEFKPYAVDTLATIGVLLASHRYVRAPDTAGIVLLLVLGCVAVWFSYPVAFVLGAAGTSLCLQAVAQRQLVRAAVLVAVSAAWLGSFALHYRLMVSSAPTSVEFMREYWGDQFVTLLPTSAADLRALWRAATRFLVASANVSMPTTAVVACLFGLVALWQQKRVWVWLLTLPVLLLGGASTLTLYPTAPRLLLFLVPAFFLLLATAIASVRMLPFAYRSTTAAVLAAFFVLPPLLVLGLQLARRPAFAREEIATVLARVAEKVAPEDHVYVYYGAANAYRWYADRFGLGEHSTRIGRSPRGDWNYYLADAAGFAGCGRTWLVFSHLTETAGMNEERFLLFFADTLGKRLDFIRARGATAHLYDFTGTRGVSPAGLTSVSPDALPPDERLTVPYEVAGVAKPWSCDTSSKHR